MKLFGFSPAALVLALVLGPLAEEALRQSLTISRGSFTIFLERPPSLWIVGITLAILAAAPLMRRFQPRRRRRFLAQPAGPRRRSSVWSLVPALTRLA